MAYQHKREEKIKEYELALAHYHKQTFYLIFLLSAHAAILTFLASDLISLIFDRFTNPKPRLMTSKDEFVAFFCLIISATFSTASWHIDKYASRLKKRILKNEKTIKFNILNVENQREREHINVYILMANFIIMFVFVGPVLALLVKVTAQAF